jgi:hypothetical protein
MTQHLDLVLHPSFQIQVLESLQPTLSAQHSSFSLLLLGPLETGVPENKPPGNQSRKFYFLHLHLAVLL